MRDPAGRIAETVDADGTLTSIERDAAGRPIRVERAGVATTIAYDALGRRVRVEGSAGAVEYDYDADHRLICQRGPVGEVRYEWDVYSRLTRVSAPGTTPTTYSYDLAGRLVAMRDAAWGKRRFAYDAAGQLTSITNALGGSTHFGYDECARLVSQTNPVGGTTRREYTPDDLVSAVTDPVGRTWRAGYDAAGRLLFTESPDGVRVDALAAVPTPGDVACDEASDDLVYVRDKDGALVRIEGGAFGTVSYEYADSSTRMIAEGLTQQWDTDELGRVASYQVQTPQGSSTTVLSYDEDGRRTREDGPDGAVSYSWTPTSQLASIQRALQTSTITWDKDGTRSSWVW